jgi:7,8-dihydropterin-6-yl-methyl-4-(beta-D-ribofuranosyl)aminobenzene 5'-phosphate synthase
MIPGQGERPAGRQKLMSGNSRRLWALAAAILLACCAATRLVSDDARGGAPALADEAKLDSAGTVPFLRILPLVDAAASRADLAKEGGVSYLVDAGGALALFDLGINKRGRDPWTLESNARSLGESLSGVSAIFISHDHSDHIGGSSEGRIDLAGLERIGLDTGHARLILPLRLDCPGLAAEIADRPIVIAQGVASLGALPMLAGKDVEQALAVNVEHLGVVLISGCGHPGLERMLERARALYDAPIAAVLGGLHYRDANEARVARDIELLKGLGVAIVGLSPHDSTPRAIEAMRSAFGSGYLEIEVGREIRLAAAPASRPR